MAINLQEEYNMMKNLTRPLSRLIEFLTILKDKVFNILHYIEHNSQYTTAITD